MINREASRIDHKMGEMIMMRFAVALRGWFVCAAVSWFCTCPVRAGFAGGTGTPDDPYQIATAEELVSIGSDPNLLTKHFVLLNDIDLDPNLPGGRIFTKAVIAPTAGGKAVFWSGAPFTGSLDGRGHRVCHLIIRAGGAGYLGLFGGLGKQAAVRDLGMVDANIGEGYWGCGALAGMNEGRIRRCYARSRVSGVSFVGALVGSHSNADIIDCWAEGEVTAQDSVGGLVGENWDGTILNSHASSRVISRWTFNEGQIGGLVGKNSGAIVNCYATGNVSALTPRQVGGGLVGANWGSVVNCHATGNISAPRGMHLGGLVGENTGFIVHSYATGNVSGGTSTYGTRDGKPAGSEDLGGLVGWNWDGHIYACYASGDVSGGEGSTQLGGLVGSHSPWGDVVDSYCVGRVWAGENSTAIGGLAGRGWGQIRASFWDTEASGLTQSAGGSGLTTAQMQNAATFLAAGWDWVGEQAHGTVDPWFIPEGGGYPMLTFQSDAFQPHQLDGRGTVDDPYRIITGDDLGAINHYDLTGCYTLAADVNLGAITWKESPVRYFSGRLDGAGRTVLNLRIQGDFCLGLFGILDRNASVANLGIHDANIIGTETLGMLAGMNRGSIATCRADGAVSAIDEAGGLVGSNRGSISDSYVIGGVVAVASTGVGGLTGRNGGSISRCYAAAHVTSRVPVQGHVNATGGLVGDNNDNNPLDPPGQIHASYFSTNLDGGGPDNGFGTPLADARMKQQASFPSWDFKETWRICEGKNYPRLRWEKIDCDQP